MPVPMQLSSNYEEKAKRIRDVSPESELLFEKILEQ